MKPSLGLATSVLLSVATVGLADECHSICAGVMKGISFKSACSAFRNSLPRPKVSSKCQAGFKAAVDMNCYDACVNGGYLQPYVYERRLDEACNGALKETPRPLCHDACVRGYRSGAKEMSTSLVKRMAQAAPTVLAALKKDTPDRPQIARNAHFTAAPGSTAVEQTTQQAAPEVRTGLKQDTSARQQATADSTPVEETFKLQETPTVRAGVKEDSAGSQQTKKVDHAVAPAHSTAVEGTSKIATFEATEVVTQRTEADSGEGVVDTEVKESKENAAAEPQHVGAEIGEVQGVDEEAEKREEIHVTDEEPRRPAGEIEEFENEDIAVDVDGEVIELEGTGHDGTYQEDIYKWIEDEEKMLLSLPITVDNMQKELTIFEGDEPMDVVLAFCRDNMPGEGACADELLALVQDKIFPDRGQQEWLS